MWFSTADPKHILQIEGFWCIVGEFNSKHPCSVGSLLQTFECLPVMRARPQNSGSITNYWKNLGVCHIWLSWMLFNFTPHKCEKPCGSSHCVASLLLYCTTFSKRALETKNSLESSSWADSWHQFFCLFCMLQSHKA